MEIEEIFINLIIIFDLLKAEIPGIIAITVRIIRDIDSCLHANHLLLILSVVVNLLMVCIALI